MRRLVLFPVLLLAACRGESAVSRPATDGVSTDSSCISAAGPGDHTASCFGLRVDVRVPATCPEAGCGLVLLLHGDTGDGLLEDAHVRLRERGADRGYIVVAPTGPPLGFSVPGSTWTRAEDAKLMGVVRAAAGAYGADPKRLHLTGFSRGGYVTWRLLCDHADVFASAAPAAAGTGRGEVACFENGRAPSREVPILFLMGRTDEAVAYDTQTRIRDLALARYGAGSPEIVVGDAQFTHTRWRRDGHVVFETFDHVYETRSDGPWGESRGHCIPGSTFDPMAPQYALPCVGPTAFDWGEEILRFFDAHPLR